MLFICIVCSFTSDYCSETGCMWRDDLWNDPEHIPRRVCFKGSGQVPLQISRRRGTACYELLPLLQFFRVSLLTLCSSVGFLVYLDIWVLVSDYFKRLSFPLVVYGPGSATGTCDYGAWETRQCPSRLPSGGYALPTSLFLGQECRQDAFAFWKKCWNIHNSLIFATYIYAASYM